MRRPVILDCFCGAGGAAMGYHQAGYDVVGIDIMDQPRYPFKFLQGDALAYLKRKWHKYDAIHASPPCQKFTRGAMRWDAGGNHLDLLTPTLDFLETLPIPWVVENVEQAATKFRSMTPDIILCGTMFGLGVFRHRAFQSNVALEGLPHAPHAGRIGDGKYHTVAGNTGGSSTRDGWTNGGLAEWRKAMGIDWMNAREIAESIPPAFTKFIGKQLIRSRSMA